MAAKMTKKARRAAALKGWRRRAKRNVVRRRNAGQSGSNNSPTRTRTATSTHATTTGNKTGTSTGGAVSGGGGNITVSVKRNPPSGYIPCKAVKITRNRGKIEVRIRK